MNAALVLAIGQYREAVRATRHAEDYGTHGDGRFSAAVANEHSAYLALLRASGENALADNIEAEAEITRWHIEARAHGQHGHGKDGFCILPPQPVSS